VAVARGTSNWDQIALLAGLGAHHESFGLIEPVDTATADLPPFALEQHGQPPIAKPDTRKRQVAQPDDEGAFIAHHPGIEETAAGKMPPAQARRPLTAKLSISQWTIGRLRAALSVLLR